jgi:hypothetical protein
MVEVAHDAVWFVARHSDQPLDVLAQDSSWTQRLPEKGDHGMTTSGNGVNDTFTSAAAGGVWVTASTTKLGTPKRMEQETAWSRTIVVAMCPLA